MSKKSFSFPKKITFLLLALSSWPSLGKSFVAPYVRFNIQKNWQCKNFSVDWICHHYLQKGDQPAIMLITAGEGKSSDNINLYLDYFRLSGQKAVMGYNQTQKIMVNRHPWVKSFRKGGLTGNMLSHYAATVCCSDIKERIHIVVGLHAPQNSHAQYINEFIGIFKTLKLSDDLQKTIKLLREQTPGHKRDMLSYLSSLLLEPDSKKEETKGPFEQLKTRPYLTGLVLALAGVVLLFFYKRKSRKRKRRSRKRRTRRKKNRR